ncbi:NosR/NirI family protein [Pseudomonas borbori]|uniref:NosR/NirI family transcriptional regulator, nitrous oxide reductase regulator n=1 Tax=Pseudomonas borbori TaxID=289003 RepID=A0A1I5SAT3_9PSED|nr:NosR/NirI family protein [Pseudomonas borbori]SFP67835.1 NosR/NirI family transcriptional regulator, nitrous oxide reductase regulator [Pseudomonas borbori]
MPSCFSRFACLRMLVLVCALFSQALAAEGLQEEILQLFPKATRIEPKQESPPVYSVYQLDELLGYAFESSDYSSLQGFSGKPIRLLIGMDLQGVLAGVRVLEHHEPVFLYGLGVQPLLDFVEQYRQHPIGRPIIVGGRRSDSAEGESTTQFDGVSKATVSVVILNETVLQAAMSVARQLLDGFASAPLATPKRELYQPMDWQRLLDKGYVQRWSLGREEVEAELGHPLSDYPEFEQADDDGPFSELHFAYLNAPSMGRNLLDAAGWQKLNEQLQSGEQALLVLSSGLYRHVPADFTPATAPSRLLLMQNDQAIELYDMHFNNGEVLEMLATPLRNVDAHIFRIKSHAAFNPAQPAALQLNVSLRRNHLVESHSHFSRAFQLDQQLFDIQQAVAPAEPVPIWLRMWQERWWQIALLVGALILLSGVFIFQHRISAHSRGFHLFRSGFLLFTLVFIGLYAQGQLSVVNIFTLLQTLWDGFDIRIFLMDPLIFILWSFTFVSLFLWGRGLFCGWLCPFGALQEILGWVAKALRIRQWKITERNHLRLQKLKYVILLGLLLSACYSLSLAERLAEVEPFKTSITLFFVRSWPFVLYALILLGLGLFVHKFYCRYLCPLGAGLAVLGKYHLFAWLKRIDACGKPCQHCRNHCEIGAIERDGRIDYDECIQCLECIVILNNDDQCVASISAHKQAQKAGKRENREAIIVSDWQPQPAD